MTNGTDMTLDEFAAVLRDEGYNATLRFVQDSEGASFTCFLVPREFAPGEEHWKKSTTSMLDAVNQALEVLRFNNGVPGT